MRPAGARVPLRTSILERLCASAVRRSGRQRRCRAARGGERSNLFLVALDEQRPLVPLPPPVPDLLRRGSQERESGQVAGLHARAAAWHRDNGNVEEAIMHAIAAGQVREASELIARHWQRAWDANPRAPARCGSTRSRRAPWGSTPGLSMARGWAALFMGPLDAVEPAVRCGRGQPVPGTGRRRARHARGPGGAAARRARLPARGPRARRRRWPSVRWG